MTDIESLRKGLIERILDGAGVASRAQRRAAFDNTGLTGPLKALVDKVATSAHGITDHDIAALRASGLGEDQIFEMVVCAAVGQSAGNSIRCARHWRWRPRSVGMRLSILDRGHGLGTKALFAFIRLVTRQPIPPVVKVVSYRPEFFGTPMKRSLMRRCAAHRFGPSASAS